MRILIIIPAYNEEGNILNTLEDLEKESLQADILVINDCSSDETLRILAENEKNYVNLPVNLGIGGAVQTGYLYARQNDYDIAIQFDGDGQHRADCLERLVQPLLDGEADMTVGSRFLPDSDQDGFQSSAARRFGIRLLSFLIRLVTGKRIYDVTSGFRAVNRALIAYYAQNYAQDYPEPEAIVMALNNGFRVVEVPVKMNERAEGKSSIRAFSSLYYMIKVSMAILMTGIHMPREEKRA